MLLRSKQDFGYGGSYAISKGSFYIAYAIEDSPTETNVAVFSFSPDYGDDEWGEIDPLFFPLEKFEVISDQVSKEWETNKFPSLPDNVYRSFPEFFKDNDMGIRMHDWNLEERDYPIVKKYKRMYESMYKDLAKEELGD